MASAATSIRSRTTALLLGLVCLTACGPETQETPDDTDSGDAEVAADTWDNFASEFMATYCVECHATAPKDFADPDQVAAFAETIRCGTASATLPDCSGWPPATQFPVGSGPVPTDEERDRLTAWIDAGMPLGD